MPAGLRGRKNGHTPIYEQLYRYIKDRIEDGTYKIGSVIPSESEMQKQFGVSRITVRRAISDLEHDGFVKKRRGAGTVVEPRKIERDLALFNSFGGSAKVRGDRPGSIILQCRQVEASVKVAEKLGIACGDPVYFLKRLRMINGRIIGLHATFIRSDLGVTLSRDDFDTSTSLYELLESRNIQLGSADETMEAKMSNAELRRDLFLEEDQPVIYKERVTYDVSGRPVEFSENTYIGEIYKYYIHIVNVREGR